MRSCNCCSIVIPSNDLEAVTVTYGGRTISLCRDHGRVIVAMLSDLQLDPPIEVIRYK